MGLAKNQNKAGATLIGDCTARGGKLVGKPAICATESAATVNDRWIRRGADNASGNSGRPSQNKGARNCTAKAAAHGTARQGAPCTEKKQRD